jgi:hypothetical protein
MEKTMSHVETGNVAPEPKALPEHAAKEADKRAKALADAKAKAPKANPLLNSTAIAAAKAVLDQEAGLRKLDLDRATFAKERMIAIVTPMYALTSDDVTDSMYAVAKTKEELIKVFKADQDKRNADKPEKDRAKNAKTQAQYIQNAMTACVHGFTLEIATTDPYYCDTWTKFHTKALEFIKLGENGGKIEAPKTAQGRGARTRAENGTDKNKGKNAAEARAAKELDKANKATLDAAKVPADEQKSFLAQCEDNPKLCSAVLYIANANMAEARIWATGLTVHYDDVFAAVKAIVHPKAAKSRFAR